MKTGLIIGIPVLIVGMLYFLFTGGVNKDLAKPTSGTTIVAFGDSLIAGVGATPGNDLASLLEIQIDEPIINLGVSGDTTVAALSRIDELLAQDPKIVIVLLGGNDYLRRVPIEDTFANLETIIQSVQRTGAVVVLLGVRGGVMRDEYKDAFEQLAKVNNVAYVDDVLSGLIGRAALMSDPIHPNDAGYQIIADRVSPVLLQILTE